MLGKSKEDRRFQIISGVIFALVYVFLIWFINARIDYLINSDDSSELILSKLLASENKLLTQNWYYSTELRVLNTQIIYSFFFRIFKSWHTVRVVSCACLYAILIFSYYFLCKVLNVRNYFLITAALLLLPLSYDYFYIILEAVHYIPHVSITFVSLALCEAYTSSTSKKRLSFLIIGFLLAVIAGMGGPRQVIILYLPLMLTSVVVFVLGIYCFEGKLSINLSHEEMKYVFFALLSFIGAAVGYVINCKILHKFYAFANWNSVAFSSFDFNMVQQLINGFLSSYGYKTGRKVVGWSFISNSVCLCWLVITCVSCVYFLKNRKKVSPSHFRLALFTVVAFAVFSILYMVTDLSYVVRYDIPIIVLSIPMIAIFVNDVVLDRKIRNLAIILFVLITMFSSCLFYKEQYNVDATYELRNIASALKKEDYTEGYATFWNANVLTELSDGTICVRDWQDSCDVAITVPSIDTTNKWLQLVEHDYTHPDGKLFLLFSSNEWENNPWVGKLSTDNTIYKSDSYIVIGYESYEALCADINYQEVNNL